MKPQETIQELIRQTSDVLRPIAVININSDQFKYHVPCKFAEESRVVLGSKFSDDQKAFVIVVSRHASTWEDGSKSEHWAIAVDWQDSNYTNYVHSMEDYYKDVENLVIMNVDPKIYTCGWSARHEDVYTYNYNAGEDVTVKQIVDFLLNTLLTQLLSFMNNGKIVKRLLIHHWAPTYTFPDCEEYFWSHLKIRDIKDYVSNPIYD